MTNALAAIKKSHDEVSNFLSTRLQQPQRMGERTESRNALHINHPLAESSAVARIPISMLPFVGGLASGYTLEDLATLALPEETTLFSLGKKQDPWFNVTDKDLAKFGLATDALDWIPGVAIAGGLATTAGLIGKALKGTKYADTTGSGWQEAFDQAVGGMAARTARGDPVNSLIDATVYHGSPHKFDKFDSARIGTGEGAQGYGHGLYVADTPEVAETYQRATSFADTKRKFLEDLPEDSEFEDVIDLMGTGRFTEDQEAVIRALEKDDWLGFDYPSQAISAAYSKNLSDWDPSDELRDAVNNAGHLYTVDLPDEHIAKMLDWDAPLSEQPESVRAAINKYAPVAKPYDIPLDHDPTGAEVYGMLAAPRDVGKSGASNALKDIGIPGIKYYDGGSRAAGEGTRNYVMFPGNEDMARITHRNGEPVNALAPQKVDDYAEQHRTPEFIEESRQKTWIDGDVPAWADDPVEGDQYKEVVLSDGTIIRSSFSDDGGSTWEISPDGKTTIRDNAGDAETFAKVSIDLTNARIFEESVSPIRDQLESIIPEGMDFRRTGRNGEYFHVMDSEGEEVTIRVLKDHKQKQGGGFNEGSGESYGDADIDIWFDSNGHIGIQNDYYGTDARIGAVAESIAGLKNIKPAKPVNALADVSGAEYPMASRQRATSFADTKRKFLEDLPEDSEFEDVIDLMGTGRFTEDQEAVIRALEKDDWLGFDYPSQAISAAYSKNLSDWDPSDELRDAVNNAGHLY
jgi:hypothetical protein